AGQGPVARAGQRPGRAEAGRQRPDQGADPPGDGGRAGRPGHRDRRAVDARPAQQRRAGRFMTGTASARLCAWTTEPPAVPAGGPLWQAAMMHITDTMAVMIAGASARAVAVL